MLPTLTQRLLIAAAAILAGVCWIGAGPSLEATGGGTGLSLLDSGSGVFVAIIVVLLFAIPAAVCAWLVSATGNILSGPFVLGTALLMLSAWGDSTMGWHWRHETPSAMLGLAVESVLWLGGLAGWMFAADRLRSRIRTAAPKALTAPDWGVPTSFFSDGVQGLIAGLIAAAGGAVAAHALLRSPDIGQVIGGLILAFAVPSGIAMTAVPKANLAAVLLSPGLVAVGAYIYGAVGYSSQDALLGAIYRGEATGLLLALPIHYASAGVVGAAIGAGAAQAMEYSRASGTPAAGADVA